MIPFLSLLIGIAAGMMIGEWFGERRAKQRFAEERTTLKERAEAAEKALDTHQRSHAGQIKHAFDTAAVIIAECRNNLRTSGQAMADAVDLTKKAAGMILPPEIEGDMTAASVSDSDRARARSQRLERETDERRSRA